MVRVNVILFTKMTYRAFSKSIKVGTDKDRMDKKSKHNGVMKKC